MARKQITDLAPATQMFNDDLLYKREGAVDRSVRWDLLKKVMNTNSFEHDFSTISANAYVTVSIPVTLSDASNYCVSRVNNLPVGLITSTTVVGATPTLCVHNTTASPIVVGTATVTTHYQ